MKLGVNIDHAATLRQVRGVDYPDPFEIALLAEKGGADYITAHLREDRRHIQDRDIEALRSGLTTYLNLEMAVTDEMLAVACRLRPRDVCLVPEKRQELTTEGGLNVAAQIERLRDACRRLAESGIRVSLFIDPDPLQIEAAVEIGAPVIEIHTGHYANVPRDKHTEQVAIIQRAATQASKAGLLVNAGHGLTIDNVGAIAAIPEIMELNIGHSIIARALYLGMEPAVREMKTIMQRAAIQL
ncbi:MAG: pyridoxine 5'-phosphate synthase [Gammaproteobacteria bacterium]|nr:pyridoxine 5'-phosphate synthase [Gammaproteobacteria bacterium]